MHGAAVLVPVFLYICLQVKVLIKLAYKVVSCANSSVFLGKVIAKVCRCCRKAISKNSRYISVTLTY